MRDQRNGVLECIIPGADARPKVSTPKVLGLASRPGCSAYDCEFVALAMDLEVPLVTCDRKLAKAFPTVARLLDQTVEGEA
jgi:hypothetical protein